MWALHHDWFCLVLRNTAPDAEAFKMFGVVFGVHVDTSRRPSKHPVTPSSQACCTLVRLCFPDLSTTTRMMTPATLAFWFCLACYQGMPCETSGLYETQHMALALPVFTEPLFQGSPVTLPGLGKTWPPWT